QDHLPSYMAHPGLSNSDMSYPTPPANDSSEAKTSFFPNSDLSSVKGGEKRKITIHDTINNSSDHSTPSTPEPSIQSHSKVRYFIKDQSMIPLLIARIAESENIKLPADSTTSSFQSGNYGDLSVSTAPSVCESVSS